MITIFRNIRETSTPFYKDIDFIFERIQSEKYGDLIKQIRKEQDKTARNELKKELPAICFSGTFSKRADDALKEHSGYICLDFDGYTKKKDMLEAKAEMSKDPYVMAAFISPSGNGLKVIVKIPKDEENHKRYFTGLQEHFNSEYFDVTSKNVSRVCYESADKDIYINYDSKLWDSLGEHEHIPKERSLDDPTLAIQNENRIVDILMKWWTKKYGLVEGERNNNVFILASAFNEYGISKSLAEYVIGGMQSSSFPMSEIKTTINSAYRNTASFNTKFFDDADTISQIRRSINNGEDTKKIVRQYDDIDNIEEVVEKIASDPSPKKFWTQTEKGAVSVVPHMMKQFLEYNGFYKFSPHNSDVFMFVKVTNNLIDKASEELVKDFVLDYLVQMDDLNIYNYFANQTRLFKKDFLSFIDTVNVHFIEDSKEFSHIYFKNCAVRVTADSIDKIDYIDLDGYVWKDQVIDRDFEHCDMINCDYKGFIENIAGGEEQRINSIQSTIGFLMSGYKDPGYCPAVILNDEVITDNPEGGTGKGLFVQGVGKLKKVIDINGKIFDI
jgi:hypothetical protein